MTSARERSSSAGAGVPHQRDLPVSFHLAGDAQIDETISNGRMRANTAPSIVDEESDTVQHQEKQDIPEIPPSGSSEDEELKLAQTMALAIQNNPNLTRDEIRKLIQTTTGGTKPASLMSTNNGSETSGSAVLQPSLLIPGRLMSGFFQSDEAEKEGDNVSSGKDGKKKSFRFDGSLRERAKGRLSEIWTSSGANSNSIRGKDEGDIKDAQASGHSSLSSTTGKDNSSRSSFRKERNHVRSPPVSPLTTPMVIADDNKFKSIVSPASASMTTSKSVPIRMIGIAWKRRGGMGKYSANGAWERRRIELQGTKLLYYRTDGDTTDEQVSPSASRDDASLTASAVMPSMDDNNNPEGVVIARRQTWLESATSKAASSWVVNDQDHTTPRGHIDLAKEKATVNAAFGHSNAPSPFAISIKVRAETKWKLCFDYHRTQMEWLAALTDVVVQGSVDSYNSNILIAADPSNQTESALFHPPQVNHPPTDSNEPAVSRRLWMMESYTVSTTQNVDNDHSDSENEDDSESSSLDERDDDVEESVTISRGASDPMTLSASHTSIVEGAKKVLFIPERYLAFVSGIVNASLAYARASSTSTENFWYAVVVVNFCVLWCLVKEPDWRGMVSQPEMRSAQPSRCDKQQRRENTKRKAAAIEPKSTVTGRSTDPSAYIPMAGSTTVKLKHTTDLPVNDKNEVFAGWCDPPGDILAVRSHGYSLTKKKIPSPGSLYNCARVDIFESPSRYPDMALRVKLPSVDFKDDDRPKTWRTPDVLIVSIALPTDPPKLGRSSSDGGGYTVTCYFTMTQETRDILRRVTADDYDPSKENIDDIQKSTVNAVRLLEEWVRRAPTDPSWFSRFKVVPNAHNLKEIGMPAWISKYNGKPFLIKRPGTTGFIFEHPELSCLEFDVSLHPFPYIAKQAICFMKESYFKKVLVSFGFVIEGKSDDQLPECVIGCMQLCYPDPAHAISGASFFDGTSKRSFQ
jgi:hypothetical protein